MNLQTILQTIWQDNGQNQNHSCAVSQTDNPTAVLVVEPHLDETAKPCFFVYLAVDVDAVFHPDSEKAPVRVVYDSHEFDQRRYRKQGWIKATREMVINSFSIQQYAEGLREALPDLTPQEALVLARQTANHW